MKNEMKAVAVIVTFNPNLFKLQKTILVLQQQNIEVVLVDNSIDIRFDTINCDSVEIILNKKNCGIAMAQNIGIARAMEQEADFVCFFDQDSNIPDNFSRNMIDGREYGIPSVFSPLVVDEDTGSELPSFRLSKFGMPSKIFSLGLENEFLIDLVISSGTVVTSKTFDLVGQMNEDLFIDLVDFEWCFRCKKFKIPIVCVPLVKMKHSIGVSKSPLTGTIHNHFRNYYKQRNPFYLLCYRHVPKFYAFRLILISLIQSSIMIATQHESKLYFKSMCMGIIDGVKYVGKTLIKSWSGRVAK
jgi:rhamnosyltransferase